MKGTSNPTRKNAVIQLPPSFGNSFWTIAPRLTTNLRGQSMSSTSPRFGFSERSIRSAGNGGVSSTTAYPAVPNRVPDHS